MAGENFDAMALSLARMAYSAWERRLVFQRTPISGETQTDSRGFPIDTPTNLQDVAGGEGVPCMYIVQAGRDVIVNEKPKTTTVYKFTIPRLYKDEPSGNFIGVPFSTRYRVRLLASDDMPEQFLEIISGGKDPGPVIIFDAIEFEA